jgi:hypothetical protein
MSKVRIAKRSSRSEVGSVFEEEREAREKKLLKSGWWWW